MTFKETLLHRWLSFPYILHVQTTRPASSWRAPTILLLHGIGNSGEAWRDVAARVPANYRVITFDLLGFGKSPKPDWGAYSARHQAKAVIATLLKQKINGPVIIVGHSLGALVAVEVAKRYSLLVQSLILCSPPFYRIDEAQRHILPSSDRLLRDVYQLARKHPDQFVKISALAVKLGLVNKSFNLTHDDAPYYMNALEASIINQTSLTDAMKLRVPTQVIYGRLDPIVVVKNLRLLATTNPNVQITSVLASHEIKRTFTDAILLAIADTTTKRS